MQYCDYIQSFAEINHRLAPFPAYYGLGLLIFGFLQEPPMKRISTLTLGVAALLLSFSAAVFAQSTTCQTYGNQTNCSSSNGTTSNSNTYGNQTNTTYSNGTTSNSNTYGNQTNTTYSNGLTSNTQSYGNQTTTTFSNGKTRTCQTYGNQTTCN
jgi:hypothetical protein